jgi:protease-4
MRLCLCAALLLLVAGCGTPSFLITPVANTYQLEEVPVQAGKGFFPDKVAIIPVEGTLMDIKTGGFLQAQENPLSLFVQQLDMAAADESVKAVVLRVNSPGGTVTTSDTMYDVLLKFRAKTHKPVIACAQEIDASGAYYLSCGADKIVASPTSLVGSIGVIFEVFDAVGTMQKIGLQSEAIKSAELKDMGSPFKHLTPHERQVMQEMVDQYFARFKTVVTTNRTLSKDPDTFTKTTDGRVFSGVDALQLGLIDQIGRLDDAIDLARQMAKSPAAEVIMYKRPYGYEGSIYANTSVPAPEANVTSLRLPMAGPFLPDGFYYLWQP